MADKQISDLTSASALTDGSLFVLEQAGAAMKANWGMMKNYISPGVAAQYSTSVTYDVGDYVIYNGQLYRCTTAITTAETWTAAHWTAAVLGDDVGDLKSVISGTVKSLIAENVEIIGWTQGTINPANGAPNDSDVRVRSTGYLSFDDANLGVIYPVDFNFQIFEYDSEQNYVGSVTNGYISGDHVFKTVVGHFYRIVVSYADSRAITPSDEMLASIVLQRIAPMTDIVSNLETEIDQINDLLQFDTPELLWGAGGINALTGKNVTSTSRIRSLGFQSFSDADLVTVICPTGYKVGVREYNNNANPQENYFVRSIPQNNTGFASEDITFIPVENYYYRFVLAKLDDSDISPDSVPEGFTINEYKKVVDLIHQVVDDKIKGSPFNEMATSNVGNFGILCAKEHNFVDGSSPTYEYYIIGDPATNKVCFSKDLTDKVYLFTFADRLGYWSFGIDSNNNIICCKQAEYLADTLAHDDSLRVNPIVYLASEHYSTAHEVNITESIKPCGWLSSVGFICLSNGDCLIAEYTRPVVETANIWKISGDPSVASNWSIKRSFNLSGTGDGFKHIHCVQQDFYTGVCYFGTGDDDTSSHVYYSLDNGDTWSVGKENSEKYCRLLNIIFTKDWCYWSTDSNKPNYHFVFKAPRLSNGVIDFNNITDLLEIPLESGMATYGCVYFPEYQAILLLERCDGARYMTAPVRVYDITTNTLHTVYTLEAVNSGGDLLGFRTRFAQWYPKNGELNLAWHLRGTSLGSDGFNQNKMFGNMVSTGDTTQTVNNACLILTKDSGTYRLVMNTRYL